MTDYRPPLGNPKARQIVCVSNLETPHGEGHNRVCVCSCQWCRLERATAGTGQSGAAQLTLALEAA